MAAVRSRAAGSLRIAAVKRLAAAPTTISPVTVATRSSASVKPSSAAMRFLSRRNAIEPSTGAARVRGALDELVDRVMVGRVRELEARGEVVGLHVGVRFQRDVLARD